MLFRRGLPHFYSGIQATSTSNLCHMLSFLLRKKKNQDLNWFDFHHITQFLCPEYYVYSNAGNWQLHDKAAAAEHTTPCWGSESKAITGSAVQDLGSPFQVSVMLHSNVPLRPSNTKQSKETVYLKRDNTTYRSTTSPPIILRSSTDHILMQEIVSASN